MNGPNALRFPGLGKLALHLYHNPVDRLRDCLREGGPFQQRHTEHGRLAMEIAAQSLPVLPVFPGEPLQVHVLSGRRFWFQTAFCLWTLARRADRPLSPIIYDDGTLKSAHREPLARLFPVCRFVGRDEIIADLDRHLPASRFPNLRERWLNYPNLRKLTDPHAGASGWKLVLDSDLLFFRRPKFILDWLDHPDRPLHAVDCETSYGYSGELLQELATTPLANLVNVGLCGLNSSELDWEIIEHWCRTLLKREGTSYYLEQALVALHLAGRTCAIAPAADYLTLPRRPEATDCRAIMHHYVAESKRWYFQHNWRRSLET